MRPSVTLLAFGLVGLGLVYAAVDGASRASTRSTARDAERQAPRFFDAVGAFGHGDAARAGLDPYAPPGLPDGVAIDRTSGLMTGLRLDLPEGSTRLRWLDLDGPAYAEGVDDVPEAVRALEGRTVTIAGFLKAIYEFEDIRTFLLVGSHLACCFGTFPGPGGVIEVTLATSEPAAGRVVEPIAVTGTLAFRPVYDSFGGRRRVALLFRIEEARIRKLVD